MENQSKIYLLPLIVALLAGCETPPPAVFLPDNTVLPGGPTVTYEQAASLAESARRNDHFDEVAAKYRAANPKPPLPEEARKYKVQAEFAVQQKQFDRAVVLYGQALEIAPWWPQGHFNRALISGELKKYREAMRDMGRYLRLAPDAPDARAAQDKIYQWEGVALPTETVVEFRDCPGCPVMVAIGKNYAIGKYEVTQTEWQAVMGNNPSRFVSANRPVERVSWNDIQTFLQKLNQKTGKSYRLPTEAEWEYACYGGSQSEYCGGNDIDAVAWYSDNSGEHTHPVGQKRANGYGLYDMSGNVWEWMSDCWEGDCAKRVLRGGSWSELAQYVRAAYRFNYAPTFRNNFFNGFRLARTLVLYGQETSVPGSNSFPLQHHASPSRK